MRFAAKASKDFEIPPAGNHVAICNAVIDLGLQPGRGMYPDPKHEVYVRFELPTERIHYTKDGRDIEGPMSTGRTFTASMSEKANLRKFIESWFGKKFPSDDQAADFDFAKILGKKCLLNVTHTEKGTKTYANIVNATPIPKGMTAEYAQHNPSLYFSLDQYDPNVFEKLPEWLQKKINERLKEPAKSDSALDAMPDEVPAGFDDDCPF